MRTIATSVGAFVCGLYLCAAPARAEVIAGTVSVRSHCGTTFVINEGDAHVSFEVAGKEAKQVKIESGQSMLLVDGMLIDVVVTSKGQIGPEAAALSGEDLLSAHQRWETEFLMRQIGLPVPEDQRLIGVKSDSPRVSAGWILDVGGKPIALGSKIERMVYVTTDIDGAVLSLVAQVPDKESQIAIFKKMVGDVQTLVVSRTPLDAAEISKRIVEEHKEGVVCTRKDP